MRRAKTRALRCRRRKNLRLGPKSALPSSRRVVARVVPIARSENQITGNIFPRSSVSLFMKSLLAAAAFSFLAIAAFAQPARDMVDANAAARQHGRDIEPALALMRNEADALSKIGEIQRALSGTPLSSIDRAYR